MHSTVRVTFAIQRYAPVFSQAISILPTLESFICIVDNLILNVNVKFLILYKEMSQKIVTMSCLEVHLR